jgi:hypothetical protein
MSEFHFDEPKYRHRLPHDPFKGLSNGVGSNAPNVPNGQRVARGGLIDYARKPRSPAR